MHDGAVWADPVRAETAVTSVVCGSGGGLCGPWEWAMGSILVWLDKLLMLK